MGKERGEALWFKRKKKSRPSNWTFGTWEYLWIKPFRFRPTWFETFASLSHDLGRPSVAFDFRFGKEKKRDAMSLCLVSSFVILCPRFQFAVLSDLLCGIKSICFPTESCLLSPEAVWPVDIGEGRPIEAWHVLDIKRLLSVFNSKLISRQNCLLVNQLIQQIRAVKLSAH